MMRNRRISGRAFLAIIAGELILIGFVAWIAAGVPGLYHDTSPPSVTIQFAPHDQPSPVRAHSI